MRFNITIPTAGHWAFCVHDTQPFTMYIDGQLYLSNVIYAETGGGEYFGDPGHGIDVHYAGITSSNCEDGVMASTSTSGGTATFLAAGPHTVDVDLQASTTEKTSYSVAYGLAGGRVSQLPLSVLNPAYGLKTSTTTPDGKTTDTSYSNSNIGPQYGLATATTVDPSGADLVTKMTYETPGATGSYLRRTSTMLPAGNATTYSYYTGTGGPIASACGLSATTPQGGQLKQQTDPAPGAGESGEARVQQFIYDAAGRQVGVRAGEASNIATAQWECTSYDARGRIIGQTWPATSTARSKSVTTTYDITGNPLETAVADSNGSVYSTVDLLGRVISYTDTSGHTTTTTKYDQAEQVTAVTGPAGEETETYNTNTAQLSTVKLTGTTEASVTYCSTTESTNTDPCAGKMKTVTYGDGTTASYAYDTYGTETQVKYTKASASFAGDEITKSPGGRELTDSPVASSGSFVNPRSSGGTDFTYDGAGRLTQAYINGARDTYSYANNATSDGCADPDGGKNTNRTSVTYYPTAGGTAKTDACYNDADQLTKTITSGSAATAASGASTSYAYNTQGYQTTNKTTTYTWSASGQVATATSGGNTVTYTDDPVNRLIERVAASSTTHYAYCGYTTSPCAVFNSAWTLTQRLITLPGGIELTAQSSGNVWSYPNLQGDYVATTNQSGVVQGALVTYDPFGAIYPKATAPADISGGATLGAFGSAGKIEENSLPTTVVFMGARAYLPSEGRFLSVDPIEGGCANAYVYVRGDAINSSDLRGESACPIEIDPDPIDLDSAGGTKSICGQTATVKSSGRTSVLEVGSEDPVGAAEQCWTNLVPEGLDCSTVDGGSGPASVCHGLGSLGTGTYTYRQNGSKTTNPTINVHVGETTTTIHFAYVAPSPCDGPTEVDV